MLYFVKPFFKKAYIFPWILLLTWLSLTILSVFELILWIQGYTDIAIVSIFMIVLVFSFLIIHAIVKHSEVENFHLLVLPIAAVFFVIVYGIIITSQPITRDFYEENGSTVLVEEEDFGSKSIIYFYKQEGILAKRVSYCIEKDDYHCSYNIENSILLVKQTNDNGAIVLENRVSLE